MKATQTLSPLALPTIAMSDFFKLPEIVACQEIQKRNPYRSAMHRKAHDDAKAIASKYSDDKGVCCAVHFGDY